MWVVNNASTVSLPPPLAHAIRNCVCVLRVITLVKVERVNWTINIRGVHTNYHNVWQITAFVYWVFSSTHTPLSLQQMYPLWAWSATKNLPIWQFSTNNTHNCHKLTVEGGREVKKEEDERNWGEKNGGNERRMKGWKEEKESKDMGYTRSEKSKEEIK